MTRILVSPERLREERARGFGWGLVVATVGTCVVWIAMLLAYGCH